MVQEKPILLFGFDFPTQNKLRFDHVWHAAFLTPRFTDEQHEELRDCASPDKRREVKYGNNVAVLFRAMLHLGEIGGQLQTGFWGAIAKGFNTNTQALMETAKILVDARKRQREKPSKDVSQTARAADHWIDFVGHRDRNGTRSLSHQQQNDIVFNFLKKLERSQVNAAGVPLNPYVRPAPVFNPSGRRYSSPGPHEDMSPTSRGPPGLFIKTEPGMSPIDRHIPTEPRSARKRSASPMPPAYSPTVKRPHHDTGNLHSPRDKLPAGLELPRTLGSHVIVSPHASGLPAVRTNSNDSISEPSRQLLEEGGGMLKCRAEELKNKLAKPDGQIETLAAIKGVNTEVSDVKEEVQSMRAVMEVMMESMHTVADNLNAIKDDIAGLRIQQGGSKQGIPPDTLPSILQPIHLLSDSLSQLRQEIAVLKSQIPPPAPPVAAQPNHELKELRELVLEQTNRLGKLSSDVKQVQHKLGSDPAPQSLRQAMAAAEHDMRHHLHTVQTYYHATGTNINRATRDKTADLIIALEQGLKCAQGGLQS
ncbi:hypothetical protein QBC34DRAFT_163110 [Podospora aff. communis PSN243]|uniref:Uncharacterized protein n=1 Tax=Podospora aff. communis PSN243 TaxID=3040156 RepID=A0AAV9GEC7_9PEZI|nr:hypothetical protein QBC34DRAFT_163110 [Podospora aff. communis PSN243]